MLVAVKGPHVPLEELAVILRGLIKGQTRARLRSNVWPVMIFTRQIPT